MWYPVIARYYSSQENQQFIWGKQNYGSSDFKCNTRVIDSSSKCEPVVLKTHENPYRQEIAKGCSSHICS